MKHLAWIRWKKDNIINLINSKSIKALNFVLQLSPQKRIITAAATSQVASRDHALRDSNVKIFKHKVQIALWWRANSSQSITWLAYKSNNYEANTAAITEKSSPEHSERRDDAKCYDLPGLELGDGRGAFEPDLNIEGSEGEETQGEAVKEERDGEGEDDARNEEQDHRPLAVPQRRHRHWCLQAAKKGKGDCTGE